VNWVSWLGLGMVIASGGIGALNAWQNKCIELAIEKLRSSLIERIALAEGQLTALTARQK
jgi:hypothetical protein